MNLELPGAELLASESGTDRKDADVVGQPTLSANSGQVTPSTTTTTKSYSHNTDSNNYWSRFGNHLFTYNVNK